MKPRISITEIVWKLHIGSRMVLGYLIFRFNPWDGFRLFLCPSLTSFKTRVLSLKVAAASYIVVFII